MVSMNFNSERRYFRSFKENLSDEARQEYEIGIRTLIQRYNTTIRENRFIVGGVVEIFTMTLLRSTGIEVNAYGAESVAGDLVLPDLKMFSVKSSFTNSGVRLVNTMGDSQTHWTTATLFVMSNIGIVYGDPLMAIEGDLRRSKDALTLTRSAINRFANDEANLVAMNIPLKPPKELTGRSLRVSASAAKGMMVELDLALLLDNLSD